MNAITAYFLIPKTFTVVLIMLKTPRIQHDMLIIFFKKIQLIEVFYLFNIGDYL